MNLILGLTVAVLFGSGTFLILKHDLIRVVAGILMISNALTLFIMSVGLARGYAPIYPLRAEGTASDPLVQSMSLTAIVIGFGLSALLLAIIYRVYTHYGTLHGLDEDLSDHADAGEGDRQAGQTRRMGGDA